MTEPVLTCRAAHLLSQMDRHAALAMTDVMALAMTQASHPRPSLRAKRGSPPRRAAPLCKDMDRHAALAMTDVMALAMTQASHPRPSLRAKRGSPSHRAASPCKDMDRHAALAMTEASVTAIAASPRLLAMTEARQSTSPRGTSMQRHGSPRCARDDGCDGTRDDETFRRRM